MAAKAGRGKSKKSPGKTIYQNPDAKKIPQKHKGKRRFDKRHLERLTRYEKLAEGGFGIIHRGRAKFKGEKGSKEVAIKTFKRMPKNAADIPEIIRRMNAGGIKHPKMDLVESGGQMHLVMEPYLMTLGEKRISKLVETGREFPRLDLKKKKDREQFESILHHVADLSHAGLRFVPMCCIPKGMSPDYPDARRFAVPLFDGIHEMWLASGKRQVVIEDLDALSPGDDPFENWRVSRDSIISAVSFNNKRNKRAAKKIASGVASIRGLSFKDRVLSRLRRSK